MKNKQNIFLFIGGELDGKRIKLDFLDEIYQHSCGDYYNYQLLGDKKYFFFYLHESLEFNEGLEMLFKKYNVI